MGNRQSEKQSVINKIVSSPPYLIVSGVAMLIGLVFNVLKMFGIVDGAAFVVGLILFFVGWTLTIIVAISSYISYKKLSNEFDILQKNDDELKDTIEKVRKEFELTISNLKDEMTLKALDNELLIETAHNGIQYTYNSATITFDKDNQIYHFEFEKHFKIISNIIPEYYQAQFYANKFITDKDSAREYYNNNPILWDALKVRANISYKKPNQNRFTNEEWLEIVNVTDNTNYIPFKIYYKKYHGKTKLNLPKGTEVKLKYCYHVPVKFWGSYINRSVSYFNEKTVVCFKYDPDLKLNYVVEKILSDGSPVELSSENFEANNSHHGNEQIETIQINGERYDRYRIKWGAQEYFGLSENDTEDGIDQLGLTHK